jgi:short-subunit dehydrogenase
MRRSIVITGASSGIGKALARRLASPEATLGLLGRDQARLDSVAAECRQRGAQVQIGAIDVRDRERLNAWFVNFDAATPIDLLFVNAGIMGGSTTDGEIEPVETSFAVAETNVVGTLNTIHPILPRMAARGSGQIAIISSIAGFIPLPDSPTYSASKAAVLNYGLALRSLLQGKGVKVSVICPGYVSTPMTAQTSGAKPFEMPPEQAAEIILRGLERNKAVITFPRLFSFLTRVGGLLPVRLRDWTSKPFRFNVRNRE